MARHGGGVVTPTAAQVKRVIGDSLASQLAALGHDPHRLPDELDLRREGIVDSLRFVQLIVDLEERLGGMVDVSDLEPEALTVVGRLAAHISARGVGR